MDLMQDMYYARKVLLKQVAHGETAVLPGTSRESLRNRLNCYAEFAARVERANYLPASGPEYDDISDVLAWGLAFLEGREFWKLHNMAFHSVGYATSVRNVLLGILVQLETLYITATPYYEDYKLVAAYAIDEEHLTQKLAARDMRVTTPKQLRNVEGKTFAYRLDTERGTPEYYTLAARAREVFFAYELGNPVDPRFPFPTQFVDIAGRVSTLIRLGGYF